MKHISIIFKYKYLLVVAFGILLLLSGCKSSELKDLENSASKLQLITAREFYRSEQDKAETLGKPDNPKVFIVYQPTDKYTVEDVYDEIIAILGKNNWEKEDLGTNQPGFYRASLPQDRFTILASINIEAESNTVSVLMRTVLP